MGQVTDDRMTVLIIDDDELIRMIARAVLEKAGIEVCEAEDGASALARLRLGETFSRVLVDLNMPGISGMDVLRAIRSTDAMAGTCVLVLTGSESEQDESLALQAGADDYIRKPIVPDLLLRKVQSVVRRAGS